MSMSCRKTRNLLSAYLDGQVSAPEDAGVAAHLRNCAACQHELEAIQFTSQLLSSLPVPQFSRDLASGVVARAAAPSWVPTRPYSRALVAARRAFVIRQLLRAGALAAFLLLATAGPRGIGNIVMTWPAHAGQIAEMGVSRLNTALDEAGHFLQDKSSGRGSSPQRSAPDSDRSGPGDSSRGSSRWALT